MLTVSNTGTISGSPVFLVKDGITGQAFHVYRNNVWYLPDTGAPKLVTGAHNHNLMERISEAVRDALARSKRF